MNLRGVFPILPTPFTHDGELDKESLERLIAYMREVGVQGVAILGFLGEAHKLTSFERRTVIETVVRSAGDALDVMVGVRALGTAGAIEQATEARELGADAVFVAPIAVEGERAIFNYFAEIARSARIPVMVHDSPEAFSVRLSPTLISTLVNETEGIVGIKLEEPPVLPKLTKILEKAPNTSVFGGLGGEYFLEELQRGAKGIMTGFAFPQVLLEIFDLFSAGDVVGAARVFDRHMPLIRYEFQPKIGLAFRKHVYKKRGLFASSYVRPPGPELDPESVSELEAIISRVGLTI